MGQDLKTRPVVLLEHRINRVGEELVKVAAPGKCIYCGDETSKLYDEHVIPLGLGGNYILEKSSCMKCAEITSKLERHVLKDMFGFVRGNQGVFSNRHEPQTKMTVNDRLIPGFRSNPETIPFSQDSPYFVPGLVTDYRPWILRRGRYRRSSKFGRVKLDFRFPSNYDEMLKNLGVGDEGISFGSTISPQLFAQMIAKIAHGFAVSELGIDGFFPFLPEYILTIPSPMVNTFLIGGVLQPPYLSLHDMSLVLSGSEDPSDRMIYWVCLLRLFSHMETPLYSVVVGAAKV